MTMFPAHRQNLRKKLDSLGGYGGTCGGGRSYLEGEYDSCFMSLGGGGSDFMAEDESRTEISINNEEAEGSSSKDVHNKLEEGGAGWLQLSLGSGQAVHHTPTSHYQRPDDQISLGPRLVELDLLPGGSGQASSQQALTAPLGFDFRGTTATAAPAASLFLQAHDHDHERGTFTQHENMNYHHLPFRPYPLSMTATLLTASSGSLGSGSGSGGRPLHFQSGLDHGPGPRMDMRVVDPPRRPHSGVWFMLQASQNQIKEPYLPQVPKSYLRIKDGRATVRLLIKYLVNKLKLDSEFEIEIRCKGQQVLPLMTLHYVRDNIWHDPRNDMQVFPRSSPTIDHLMVLNYGRIA